MDEKKRLGVLKKAMQAELARNVKHLRIDGHPAPYFISYLVRDTEKQNIWGRYGAVSRSDSSRKRFCYADVRVGNARYDQITQGGLNDNSDEAESYDYRELPKEDDIDVLRFNLWRLTDCKYREAIQAFHRRKLREVNFLDDNKGIPAFQTQKSQTSNKRLKKSVVDTSYWEKLVRTVGAALKTFPDLKNSFIEFSAISETKVFISSEGIERVWRTEHFSLSAYLWLLSAKGDVDANVVINTPDIAELPDVKGFKRQVCARIEEMRKVLSGKEMVSFGGPVLLAPRPAGLLLHEVLGHRLEGSRLLSADEGRTFVDKLGKVITHKDISVYDDPTLKKYDGQALSGHYDFDDEGSVPKRTVLVKDGVLKEFLTTRTPNKKRGHVNNGHARAETFERPISRMGNLIIKGKNGKSWDELKQLLVGELHRQNRPFGVILYEVEGGETGTTAYDFQAFLGEIKVATKIFPDGREEHIKGVDFVGTPLVSLTNILAAGDQLEVDNSYCGAESGYIPVSTVSPALLLSNLELQTKGVSRVTQYVLPLPWHEKAQNRRRP